MYLSKLELHGFKSFANRTNLFFDPGVTAVVGPNGCGKSNIVDAVRWVIGEQRARILRSEKMENVIFNGTSKKRPLGMAEVMLTIENTQGILPVEYGEVTIGRRLFRSGESEYLMNGVQCRLKDITDLFMDTGMGAGAYSVIELKMVEEILSENTNDRRHLFEEAAGITKYKLRRAQTLRKLASTQADLTRVQDLLEEIEKRVRSLKRQANKAARFKEIEVELRTLELALAAIEFDRLSKLRDELQGEIKNLQDSLEGQTAQHGTYEADLEALRVRLVDRERLLSEAQQELAAHLEQMRNFETERKLQVQRIEMSRRDLQRLEREEVESAARLVELQDARSQTEAALESARPEHERAIEALRLAEAKRDETRALANEARQKLADLRNAEQRASDDLANSRRSLDRMSSQIDLIENDRDSNEKQREQIKALGAEAGVSLKDLQQTLDTWQDEVNETRNALDRASDEQVFLETEFDEARTYLRSLESRREALIAQIHLLESVIASYDDFSESVQYLAANDSEWSSAGMKTVSDIISCDPEYRLALENALREFAGCIVVEDTAELHAAVNSLKKEDKGRASFIVLNQLKSVSREGIPSRTPLQDVVQLLDGRYSTLASTILAGCYLADSNEEAERMASEADYGRFFVPGGAWYDARGIAHSGSSHGQPSTAMGRLDRRRQLEQARKDLTALSKQINDQERTVEQTKLKLDNTSVEELELKLKEQLARLRESENSFNRARYECETIEQRQGELFEKYESLESTLQDLRDRITATRTSVTEAEKGLGELREQRSEAEEEFHSLEADSRVALNQFSEASVEAVEARNRFENLEKDIQRIERDVTALNERAELRITEREEIQAQQQTSENELAVVEDQLETVRRQRPEFEEKVSEAKNGVMEVKVSISDLESELREIRREKEEQMRAENTRAVKLAEVLTRLEDLEASVLEDYGLNVIDIDDKLDEETDEKSARQRVRELRQQVRSIGPINALALEEYEEEKERLEFISSQFEDLKKAEQTLVQTIDEINTTASTRFNETFEAIRANFRRLFSELFGDEASADLELTDPNDPLESPVEVFAKPRGKRPSVLAQLSGGEKTLTAIALLFAIYLVKPSPFCILDEVDAPLDDANVGRFMHLIREFSKSTQFILVTHNKRTMEAADRMYGITMQEQGVSKLVGVNFEKKEDDEDKVEVADLEAAEV